MSKKVTRSPNGQKSKNQEEQIQKLEEKAQQGDKSALKKFETLPDAKQFLMEVYGELGKHTQQDLLASYLKDNEMYKRGVALKAEALQKELEGPDPSALERLLVERVVACWIDTNMVDRIVTHVQAGSEERLYQWTYYQKRQERAQRRFLAACKALAQVRRLLRVNIQVNIAEKQINIAE